jgi:protein-L-isoaspartate(D-aspartate) O-methyltransferase
MAVLLPLCDDLDQMTLEDCRQFYAEEIRLIASVKSNALVEALEHVPREKFLGPPPWQIASPEQSLALSPGGSAYIETSDPRDLYHNLLVAIDPARRLNNGQPSALLRWIDALDLKPGDRAYHLGCGVGYYTAIIAEAVGPTGSVLASEVDSDLAARARANLASYPNVTVLGQDGATVDPGVCDAIMINAGVTHPEPGWLDRLSENGRLILPITTAIGRPGFGAGVVVAVVRRQSEFSAHVVTQVAIYNCTSVRDPDLEKLVAKALATPALTKIRSLRRDDHELAETCALHAKSFCLSTAEIAPDHAESVA